MHTITADTQPLLTSSSLTQSSGFHLTLIPNDATSAITRQHRKNDMSLPQITFPVFNGPHVYAAFPSNSHCGSINTSSCQSSGLHTSFSHPTATSKELNMQQPHAQTNE